MRMTLARFHCCLCNVEHHEVVCVVKVLGVVESSLAEYEKLTGRQNNDDASFATTSPKSFSGYTMALLEAVAKMSVYVKEVMYRTFLLHILTVTLQLITVLHLFCTL